MQATENEPGSCKAACTSLRAKQSAPKMGGENGVFRNCKPQALLSHCNTAYMPSTCSGNNNNVLVTVLICRHVVCHILSATGRVRGTLQPSPSPSTKSEWIACAHYWPCALETGGHESAVGRVPGTPQPPGLGSNPSAARSTQQ